MGIIISAFPATGKTYCFEHYKEKSIADSDSSEYSWIKDEYGNGLGRRNPKFPNNYIQHIKNIKDKYDVIFVSSHQVVRNALKKAGIDYYLIYPDKTLFNEYVNRCTRRINGFDISLLITNWDKWIEQCANEAKNGITTIKLHSGEHASDVIDYILATDNLKSFFGKNYIMSNGDLVLYKCNDEYIIEVFNKKILLKGDNLKEMIDNFNFFVACFPIIIMNAKQKAEYATNNR